MTTLTSTTATVATPTCQDCGKPVSERRVRRCRSCAGKQQRLREGARNCRTCGRLISRKNARCWPCYAAEQKRQQGPPPELPQARYTPLESPAPVETQEERCARGLHHWHVYWGMGWCVGCRVERSFHATAIYLEGRQHGSTTPG